MNSQNSMLSLIAHNRCERYAIGVLFTALLIATLAIILPHHSTPLLQATAPPATPAAKVNLAKLPLYFIENQGQSDAQVAYYLQGRDTSVYFTPDGITLALQEPMPATEATAGKPEPLPRLGRSEPATTPSARQRWAVKVQFVDAEPVQPQGRAKTAAFVSYFKGPPSDWKTGLSTYTEVAYPDVWPGIAVVYSGDGGQLKTTFHVQPGADPDQIQLAYQGATAVTLTDAGRLAIQTPVGGFEEDQPLVYQDIDGRRMPVEARYTLVQTETGDWRYGFALGDYDRSHPLIIDPPILVYCGYIGGGRGHYGYGIAVDSLGQAYVVGNTDSWDFPVRGGPDLTYNLGWDAFIAKVSADGTQLVYAGYIGGSGYDRGWGIAVDGLGQAYVVGATTSSEATFPVRGGPDLTFNGDPYGGEDAFVAKISADGSQLVYAGYIGGSSDDGGYGIAVDGLGQAYVVGYTDSTEATFPVRGGPDLTYNGGGDAFVAKVSADGTHLLYAGYIGGSGVDLSRGIAMDGLGQAYVVGDTGSTEATFPVRGGPDLTYNLGWDDAFVAKVSADGTQLIYAGYIGGSGHDEGYGIAVDNLRQAYVVGYTPSTEASFPVRGGPDLTYNGGYKDAFVAKVSADGTQLVYAGYIGGSSDDVGYGIAVNESEQAYVVGITGSTQATFPVRGGPDLTYNGGGDAFVAKVSADGTQLVYAGYIGGSATFGEGIAVDELGQAYVVGNTTSTEASFPVRGGPDLTYNGGINAFVAKVVETDTPPGYALTVTKAGNGTVASSPAGINCGSDCIENYTNGTLVTLTPTPASGSRFAGWSGACTGTGACHITMDQDRAVTATFNDRASLIVVKTGSGSGRVTSNPAGIDCGNDCSENYRVNTLVRLMATPATGSSFTGWSGACSGKGACQVRMTQARSVIATFVIPNYVLAVRKTGNGSGTVTSRPAGITCGSDCNQSYASGKVVTLTAKPSSNSVFVGWSGACHGTAARCTVTMTQARTVTAAFTQKGYYLLTVSKAGSGSGTVTSSPAGINCGSDCDHTYRRGATVKLTAKARFDSVFAGWKGACSGRSSTCQVTLSKTQAVTATFNRRGAASNYNWQELFNPQESGGDADSAVNLFPWETDR